MKRDAKGRFTPTPSGKKTPKMLEVERKLGCSLEEDFYEYHIKKGWGQKRIANKWGVKRNLIFAKNLRGGRRSWSQMLNLPVRRLESEKTAPSKRRAETCEICSESEVALVRAHWVGNADGGSSRSFNILKLCPNCHSKLDGGDPETTKKAQQVLLFREVKKIVEDGGDIDSKRKRLVEICRAILERIKAT
jgi:hypothetical protein